jgi:plastocyanin
MARLRGGDQTGERVRTTAVTMVKSYRFAPDVIEVDRAAAVEFANEDDFTHTVQVDGGRDHEVPPGERVSIRFDEAGTHHDVCTLHPHHMEGEVIVR